MKTLILGIGNLLLGDEGLGVHAARRLQDETWCSDVTVLDVGTAILDALPHLQQAERVIVIDAMKAEQPPGTVYRIPLSGCAHARRIPSLHGIDLFGVLSLTGRTEFPEVVVYGIEPARIDWSLELSSVVKDSLPTLIKAVLQGLHPSHDLPNAGPDPPSGRCRVCER